MRETKELTMFGKVFRVKQYSAVEGLAILFSKERVHPTKALAHCVIVEGDNEIPLTSSAAINKHVFDDAEIVPPAAVLTGLIKLIDNFNFDFIVDWKSVHVPSRFISGARTVSPKNTPSIINQLIQDGVATKKELEEYYSLMDAFQMLDIMTAKGVNAALSQEAAEKARK